MATTYQLNYALGNDEGDPVLVFWKAEVEPGDGDAWEPLSDHDCNGFSIDKFAGFVVGLRYSDKARSLINQIADEKFCLKVLPGDLVRSDASSLDWGVEDPHRRAYVEFLNARGLEAGRIELLQQAVYPLALTAANLEKLGVDSLCIPRGAELLILGSNCD